MSPFVWWRGRMLRRVEVNLSAVRQTAEGALRPLEGLVQDKDADRAPPTPRTSNTASIRRTRSQPLSACSVEKGVPAADALAGSGLSDSRLNASATRVSYQQMLTVFRNALRLTPDPALALLAGQRMHVTAYGMYGYALLSSPTHAAGVDFAARHHRVMGPVADMVVKQSDDEVIFSYQPVLAPDPSRRALPLRHRVPVLQPPDADHRPVRHGVPVLAGAAVVPCSGACAAVPQDLQVPGAFQAAGGRAALRPPIGWPSPCRTPTRSPMRWRARCARRAWPRSSRPS